MFANRQEWLEWRQKGIGGSDAPIIMGVSEYKTRLQLYDEKTAAFVEEDTSNQYIKDRGNDAEPKIRSLFELLKGDSFEPAMVESAEFPWLRASLDGRNPSKTAICELKLLNREDWTAAKEKGIVPAQYVPQCHHNNMVSGAEVCFFGAYLYSAYMADKNNLQIENLAIVPVMRSDEYMEQLFKVEQEFWMENVVKRKPPVPGDKDYKALTGLAKTANKWKALKSKIDVLDKELEACRKELIEAAKKGGHPRYICAGVRMRQSARVGNVQYNKIPELKGVDLEQYRGAGSVSWTLDLAEKED